MIWDHCPISDGQHQLDRPLGFSVFVVVSQKKTKLGPCFAQTNPVSLQLIISVFINSVLGRKVFCMSARHEMSSMRWFDASWLHRRCRKRRCPGRPDLGRRPPRDRLEEEREGQGASTRTGNDLSVSELRLARVLCDRARFLTRFETQNAQFP